MKKRFYGTQIPGSLSPVPATEEMTQEVGVRDGQLYTKPGGKDEGLETRVGALERNLDSTNTRLDNAIEEISESTQEINSAIGELQTDVAGAEDNITSLNSRVSQNAYDIGQNAGNISALGISKQDKLSAQVVTINPSDWVLHSSNGFVAIKSVLGVTASNLVQVAPDPESIDDYMDYNIICDAQAQGTLQFHAKDISSPPSVVIKVNVVVWG